MIPRNITIVILVVAILSLTSKAMAGPIAYSYLSITDLFVISEALVPDFTTSDASGSATGSPPDASISVTANTQLACSGECSIGEDDSTKQTPGATFGRGDTAGDSNSFWLVSEGQIAGAPPTSGTSVFGSSDISFGFDVTLDVGEAGSNLSFEFDALADLFVDTTTVGSISVAQISFFFRLLDSDGVEIFSWSPDGSGLGIIGGQVLSDPFSLNTALSAVDGSGPLSIQGGPGFFSAITDPLDIGSYTLGIQAGTGASAFERGASVPEPGGAFLLGGGLLMLGFSRRLSHIRSRRISAA